MRTFYMVWRFGGGVPHVQHETFDLAKAEADRLAAIYPGWVFVVLKSKSLSFVPRKPIGVPPSELAAVKAISDLEKSIEALKECPF